MSIKTIAICTDFSENADDAFATALEMAQHLEAKLYLIHVVPPVISPVFTDFDSVTYSQPDASLVPKIEERIENTYGSKIDPAIAYEVVVLEGHVSSEILNFLAERKIDLVIMGAYGLTGMGLVVFGSVAKRVSHKAPCSVMIVRAKTASP